MTVKHVEYSSTLRLGRNLKDRCTKVDPERDVLSGMLDQLKNKWNSLRSLATQRYWCSSSCSSILVVVANSHTEMNLSHCDSLGLEFEANYICMWCINSVYKSLKVVYGYSW